MSRQVGDALLTDRVDGMEVAALNVAQAGDSCMRTY